jgi:hypothetical protein
MTTPLTPQFDFNEITQLIHTAQHARGAVGEYGVDRVAAIVAPLVRQLPRLSIS